MRVLKIFVHLHLPEILKKDEWWPFLILVVDKKNAFKKICEMGRKQECEEKQN